MTKFGICKCFYTDNYFVRSIGAHLRYETDDQFCKAYASFSEMCGVPMADMLAEVKEEKERRVGVVDGEAKRRSYVQSKYTPRHKEIYTIQEKFFDEKFLALWRDVSDGKKEQLLKYRVTDEKYGLYQFPVFTSEFCRLLLEEVANFESTDLPKMRPNTMNYYGILLDEIGFKSFFNTLCSTYMSPLANAIYPEWTGTSGLDSHRAFTVSYKADKEQNKKQQVDLSLHYDNAEVTLNVSLNVDFEGGEVYFGNVRTGSDSVLSDYGKDAFVEHKLGWGVFHRARQMHGALQIDNGIRHNLIFWMRASSLRNSVCPRCWKEPVLMPAADDCYGDGMIN